MPSDPQKKLFYDENDGTLRKYQCQREVWSSSEYGRHWGRKASHLKYK
jgi:hypothetical protein